MTTFARRRGRCPSSSALLSSVSYGELTGTQRRVNRCQSSILVPRHGTDSVSWRQISWSVSCWSLDRDKAKRCGTGRTSIPWQRLSPRRRFDSSSATIRFHAFSSRRLHTVQARGSQLLPNGRKSRLRCSDMDAVTTAAMDGFGLRIEGEPSGPKIKRKPTTGEYNMHTHRVVATWLSGK